jgi:hypothetical protein
MPSGILAGPVHPDLVNQSSFLLTPDPGPLCATGNGGLDLHVYIQMDATFLPMLIGAGVSTRYEKL